MPKIEPHTQKVIAATLADYDGAIATAEQAIRARIAGAFLKMRHHGVGDVATMDDLRSFALRTMRRAVEVSVTKAAIRMQEGWLPAPGTPPTRKR